MPVELSIQDFLDASSDATKRTRRVLLTMIVASVLTFIAVLNSLHGSWKQHRLEEYQHPDEQYIKDLIGEAPGASASQHERDLYNYRYSQMFSAIARSYTETNSVQIPFFGISCDINDLGIVSGMSLLIILVWFRLCIRAEIENLNLSFAESRQLKQLAEFYYLLAMRQVLISPRVPGRIVHKFYLWVPTLMCMLPAAVYVWLLLTDFPTAYIGAQLHLKSRTSWILAFEVFFVSMILLLTYNIWQRWRRLEHAWTWYWCECVTTVTTDPKRRNSGEDVNSSLILEHLQERLKESMSELQGQRLEESVLSSLSAVEGQGNGCVYIYRPSSPNPDNILLRLTLDKRGKLETWHVDRDAPRGDAMTA